MILAGIDEAGYGPLLGPLVVGGCAFEFPGDPDEPVPPCLWKRLSRIVSKKRTASGRRLHINDSKAVYSAATGLKELERSVLSMLAGREILPETLNLALEAFSPRLDQQMSAHPWYAPSSGEAFPLEQDLVSIRIFANALRHEQDRSQTRCAYLSAQVLLEGELNRQLAATRNKASVLFSLAARHLDHLLRNFAGQGLVIICDRQGGRGHYGHLLRMMFEDWELSIVSETESRAEYHLSRSTHRARIIFTEKAETQCLSVALASMLSKYLREALMRRFNAFWRSHLPDLPPTAGYYQDGLRFLEQIDAKRRELRIDEARLVRAR